MKYNGLVTSLRSICKFILALINHVGNSNIMLVSLLVKIKYLTCTAKEVTFELRH